MSTLSQKMVETRSSVWSSRWMTAAVRPRSVIRSSNGNSDTASIATPNCSVEIQNENRTK